MKWCVFYADGTVCSSQFNEPRDVPGLGAVVIVQAHQDPQEKPYLQHETDYYVWKGDRWQGCDLFYLWQYIFVDKTDYTKVALAGETVKNTEYMQIMQQARALRDQWYDSTNL